MQSDGKKVSKQEVKWVKVRVDMIWCVCIFYFFKSISKAIKTQFNTVYFSWVVYENEQFSGNLYVLSEGDYPNLTSMGCPPDCSIRSVKIVPLVRNALTQENFALDYRIPLLVPRVGDFMLWVPTYCTQWPYWMLFLSPVVLSSFHLFVRAWVSGGQRDHHRHRDPEYGRRRLQQPHPVAQSQQRLVT